MATEVPFRAVGQGEDAVKFDEYLGQRVMAQNLTETQTRALFRRMLAFIQEYDHLQDEKRAEGQREPPTPEEYATRWNEPARSVARTWQEFRTIFSGADPSLVCDELWAGISRQAPNGQIMRLLGVKVAPRWP
jgi:hypothetical protein